MNDRNIFVKPGHLELCDNVSRWSLELFWSLSYHRSNFPILPWQKHTFFMFLKKKEPTEEDQQILAVIQTKFVLLKKSS